MGDFTYVLELVYPDGEVSRTASNFVFGYSSPHFDLPIHQDIHPSISGLRTFLDAHPENQLFIEGFFRDDETNKSSYSNLGVARANQIKEDLKVTIRCIPLQDEAGEGECIFTGQSGARRAVFAKAY